MECSRAASESALLMHRRRTRRATLSSYLALLCLAVLLDVGRGNHRAPECAVLEAINKPPDGRDTVFRTDNNPGRFKTSNFDSPDATIRTVLEYSENPSFEDLPELDLARDVFDKTAPLDEYGVDIDISMRGSAIKSGRFVFTKKRPDSSFIFPVTRQLENGVDYYFRNYKVRDGCISPPPETFLLYPSEVVTKPIFLQVWGGQGLSSRGGV
jgi:hypothetical protein